MSLWVKIFLMCLYLTSQLTRMVAVLAEYHTHCNEIMKGKQWFPIELDLRGTTLCADYKSDQTFHDQEDEEEEVEEAEAASESLADIIDTSSDGKTVNNTSDLLSDDLHLLDISSIGLGQPINTEQNCVGKPELNSNCIVNEDILNSGLNSLSGHYFENTFNFTRYIFMRIVLAKITNLYLNFFLIN